MCVSFWRFQRWFANDLIPVGIIRWAIQYICALVSLFERYEYRKVLCLFIYVNMGYVPDIAKTQARNLFSRKCAPIPLGHSIIQFTQICWSCMTTNSTIAFSTDRLLDQPGCRKVYHYRECVLLLGGVRGNGLAVEPIFRTRRTRIWALVSDHRSSLISTVNYWVIISRWCWAMPGK